MPLRPRRRSLLLLLSRFSLFAHTKPADWTIYITNDACSYYTWGCNEERTRR